MFYDGQNESADHDRIAAQNTWVYSAFREMSWNEQDEILKGMRLSGNAHVADYLSEFREDPDSYYDD